MTDPVYKITTAEEWEAAQAAGVLEGTAVDIRDGFIHFSTATQLEETLDKHYAGQTGIVLAKVDPDRLETPLLWETSRGGALFPHLYAPLHLNAVVATQTLEPDADGRFDLKGIL